MKAGEVWEAKPKFKTDYIFYAHCQEWITLIKYKGGDTWRVEDSCSDEYDLTGKFIMENYKRGNS